MKNLFRGIALTSAVALVALMVPGCNTVRGVGKDIKRGGQGIEKVADKTQEKMKK